MAIERTTSDHSAPPGAQEPRDLGCKLPPAGWWCSREPGHEGPCAARQRWIYRMADAEDRHPHFGVGGLAADAGLLAVQPSPLPMTTADRIAARRLALGWSQADLAARLDVSDKQVSQWETGHRTPNAQSLVKLATALGVTAGWLLGMED